DDEFALAPDGGVQWRGGVVGRLLAGDSLLTPRIEVLPGDFLEGSLRELVRRRLTGFLRQAIEQRLAPLFRIRDAALDGPARDLSYQLVEWMGSLNAGELASMRASLGAGDRKTLARLGVRLGTETIYVDSLLKPAVAALRGLLWAIRQGEVVPAVPAGPAGPRD